MGYSEPQQTLSLTLNPEVLKMNGNSKARKIRNLSICPLTPDPPEILDLIADLKKYLKTIDYYNESIYAAYFSFEYDGVMYRMDYSVLSAAPSDLVKEEAYISDKLEQMGAGNISLYYRCD